MGSSVMLVQASVLESFPRVSEVKVVPVAHLIEQSPWCPGMSSTWRESPTAERPACTR
jgi:hypothetical protein